VAVKRSDADAGPFCHGLQTRVRPTGAEHSLRRLQHALVIANRIGAGPPDSCCGLICHLNNLDHDSMSLNRGRDLIPLFEHDLFRKWLSAFLYHALVFRPLEKRRMPPYMQIRIKLEASRRSARAATIQFDHSIIGALHELLHQPHR
jgi:hypothetical protein